MLFVILTQSGCGSKTIPVSEAQSFGIHEIDQITLRNGMTLDFDILEIDHEKQIVSGFSSGQLQKYRFDEIESFGAKPPFWLIPAGFVGAYVVVSVLLFVVFVAVMMSGMH
jgi:hypothetical protein